MQGFLRAFEKSYSAFLFSWQLSASDQCIQSFLFHQAQEFQHLGAFPLRGNIRFNRLARTTRPHPFRNKGNDIFPEDRVTVRLQV